MNTILVPKTNFDQAWAGELLEEVFLPDSKVLIFHFSESHEFDFISFDYEEDIIRPFLTYGIKKNHIVVINPYLEESERIQYLLEKDFDVVCFVGNNPYEVGLYLEDYGIKERISNYEGTLLWVGEVGYLACETFGEGYPGLGLLDQIEIDLNYRHDEDHLHRVIHLLEMGASEVVLIPEEGGLIALSHYYDIFGQAMIVTEKDLDMLYQMYESCF